MDSNSILDLLVYGWYHKQNAGDDLFAVSFQKLFPNLNIKFTDDPKDITKLQYKYLILGGGNIIHPCLQNHLQQTKTPYEFWSVSVLTPEQATIAQNARRCIVRDNESAILMTKAQYKGELIFAPDIVFTNHNDIKLTPKKDIVALFPNANIAPTYKDTIPKWQEYQRFVCETARFMDEQKDQNNFELVAMQTNHLIHDHSVSHAIRATSVTKKMTIVDKDLRNLNSLNDFKVIITARYHGIILAIMSETPVVCIDAHSKIKNFANSYKLSNINYYEYSKDCLERALKECMEAPNRYRQIKQQIIDEIGVYYEFSKQLTEEIS